MKEYSLLACSLWLARPALYTTQDHGPRGVIPNELNFPTEIIFKKMP